MTELANRLSLRQTAVTEPVKRAEEIERSSSPVDGRVSMLAVSAEGERRLLAAFVGLREERRQLAEAMRAFGTSFRAFVHSQDEEEACQVTAGGPVEKDKGVGGVTAGQLLLR